jgi:hypothetical protein
MPGRPTRHRTAAEYTPETDPAEAEGKGLEPSVPLANESVGRNGERVA